MRVEAEDAITQVFFEAGHHRQDDIERHHADHHADRGDSGDQRDERLAPLGPQIAQANEEFVPHRGWGSGVRGQGFVSLPFSVFTSPLTGPWPPTPDPYFFSGRISGKRITSRIEGELVNNITRRSMPSPSPAVGGIPYSKARI